MKFVSLLIFVQHNMTMFLWSRTVWLADIRYNFTVKVNTCLNHLIIINWCILNVKTYYVNRIITVVGKLF